MGLDDILPAVLKQFHTFEMGKAKRNMPRPPHDVLLFHELGFFLPLVLSAVLITLSFNANGLHFHRFCDFFFPTYSIFPMYFLARLLMWQPLFFSAVHPFCGVHSSPALFGVKIWKSSAETGPNL